MESVWELENDEKLDKKFDQFIDDEEELKDDSFADDDDVEEDIPENNILENDEVDTEKFLAKLSEGAEDPLIEKRVFQCPKCKRYYYKNKWVHDPSIGISVLKPDLAFCNKCIKHVFEDDWIGRVIIHDKQLKERKEMFLAIADQIARTRENVYSFESILSIYEENGVLYINTNTTELAKAIGKRLQEDYHGAIEYHWEDKNQYLTVKWFDELKNSHYYKGRLKQKKERYPGIYLFDDDES